MQWFRWKAAVGALALAGMTLTPARSSAQSFSTFTVTVEDLSGAAVPGATVADAAGHLLGRTDADGRLDLSCASPCRLRVEAAGFEGRSLLLSAGTILRLEPAADTERVTVTAYRTPLGSLESPVTTRLLTQQALNTTAAITLDDTVRQLPGVELFRRSSSLVANPSSQGISLRGLGSTSASRTLITEDDVPLNDPVGGWIHWQEIPELAVKSIEVVRGGASDLYGSSAIGGVVSVIPVSPGSDLAELRLSYGGEGTFDESLLMETKRGHWGLLASGGLIGTDGYIQEAPLQRGPVDEASLVHSQNALLLAERNKGPLRLFMRASGFNDSRHNGTPYQVNGTRLVRYATGGDWQGPHDGTLAVRLYGSDERYRQTFSSISNLPNFGVSTCAFRCGEVPTRFSFTPDNELGAAAHWNQPVGAGLLLVAGADVHDVRFWDREQTFGNNAALTSLHDHQRDSAAYVEALWIRKGWTVTASGRMDWFQNYDGQLLDLNGASWVSGPTQPPQRDERILDPRMGLSRKVGSHWAISASGFRAFRAPTPSELYRSTQVGNKLTNPNGALLSERATGWETGVATEWRWGVIRSSYFLTQVNRPITALTMNAQSSPILLVRENLGQIASRGVAVDFQLAPRRWMTVDGGYQFARATVMRGMQDLGNWIPEVARNQASLNLRAYQARIGTLSVQSRLSGRQFDDDANSFLLHGYLRLDAYASRDFGKRLQVFTAGENLVNRQIEDSKTPTTTLGMPRVARVGFLVRLGAPGK
jgi:outer membrane receptor protein involved in Fe transport